MFFQEKINIKNDFTLEIGPGGYPFSKSDILFDRFYKTGQDIAQSGGTGIKTGNKYLISSQHEILPFKDKVFDYLICSHVMEHVDVKDMNVFLNEIKRVAKKIYLEFPSVFYEFLFDIDEHKTVLFISEQENIIYAINKDKVNFIGNRINRFFK